MSEAKTGFRKYAAAPLEATRGPIGNGVMARVQPSGIRGPATGKVVFRLPHR